MFKPPPRAVLSRGNRLRATLIGRRSTIPALMSNRRQFVRTLSLGSAALLASPPWRLNAAAIDQIENQFLAAQVDASGRIQVERKGGQDLLRNAMARVTCGGKVRTTSDAEYARSGTVRPIRDALGPGRQLSITCRDRGRELDLELLLTLHDGRNELVLELIARNVSGKDLPLTRMEPVRAVLEEGGACGWGEAERVLTNGFMYPDPGRVELFGPASLHPVTSVWNMGFYRAPDQEGLVVGYLDSRSVFGRISAVIDRTQALFQSRGGMSITAESTYNTECILPPGESATSGKVIFLIAGDTFSALESYAQAVASVCEARLNPIINGWCSWYYTHEYVDEEEVLRNAEFAARRLKPYGLETIQVDAGWYRTYGDWEGNERFPHGMQWLAERIRALGLRPGVWFAPFCIAEGTEVVERHPDWLLVDREGKPRQCGGGLSTPQAGPYGIPSMMKKVYGLDVTHPDAARWLGAVFRKAAESWGYDFFKIDFVEWTILSADRYHDPSFSKAAAYRRGIEAIRQAIGPRRHLLDCGPMNTTVGLVDSARIELDLPRLTWEQYTGNFNSNGPAMAKRYYFNGKTWINDADHLGLALLTIPQARAAATIIALSGGTLISGDRLVDLDSERMEILQRVYPAHGVAARPIDLFENDRPEIFALPVRTKFGEWAVIALFNYADAAMDKHVDLKRLQLPASSRYLVFEFWSQEFLGDATGELRVRVEPNSVALLSVHAVTGAPQAIGTDRHFTQGAVELEDVRWDAQSLTLAGVSLGPAQTSHNVSIYVPAEYRRESQHPDYYEQLGSYSVQPLGGRVLHVRPRFGDEQRTEWHVRFRRSG